MKLRSSLIVPVIAASITKQQGQDHNKDKGNKQGEPGIYKELKAAVQKKDQAAINSALEKLEQQSQSSNQQLQQEIEANR